MVYWANLRAVVGEVEVGLGNVMSTSTSGSMAGFTYPQTCPTALGAEEGVVEVAALSCVQRLKVDGTAGA